MLGAAADTEKSQAHSAPRRTPKTVTKKRTLWSLHFGCPLQPCDLPVSLQFGHINAIQRGNGRMPWGVGGGVHAKATEIAASDLRELGGEG